MLNVISFAAKECQNIPPEFCFYQVTLLYRILIALINQFPVQRLDIVSPYPELQSSWLDFFFPKNAETCHCRRQGIAGAINHLVTDNGRMYALHHYFDFPITFSESHTQRSFVIRSDETPSDLKSLMRISYLVFFLKKNKLP